MASVKRQLAGLGLKDKDFKETIRYEISKMHKEAKAAGNKTEMSRLEREYVKYGGKAETLRKK
jgi:hypothetical protein